jgi:hypothetical protein
MLASRVVGTSDRPMLSMCAIQALREVSLRSPADATLLFPFEESSAGDTLATEEEWYKARRDCRGNHRRDDSYYVSGAKLSFREDLLAKIGFGESGIPEA